VVSQEYLDGNTVHYRNREARSTSTDALSRRILVAYPGEKIAFSVAVRKARWPHGSGGG